MIGIETVLLSIAILFFLFVGLRQFPKFKICALCASVSTTWIALLVLWLADFSIDPVLIGILMGGSLVGAMYLLEEKTPTQLHLFKLPYLTTGFVIIAYILGLEIGIIEISIILGLWILFSIPYFLRNSPGFKDKAKQIIECCKNW